MQQPYITLSGHVGAAPRTRIIAGGTVVSDFRIASTPRKVDKDGNWSDLETIWFSVSCWRQLGENVGASLNKGDKVIVSGWLAASSWTTENGETRSGLQIDRATVGFDLSRGRAVLERSAPQDFTRDPGYITVDDVGTVSMTTGEMVEADLLDEDELSLGDRLDAVA